MRRAWWAGQEATRFLIKPYNSITYQSLSTRVLCNLCLGGKCNSHVIADFAKIALGGEKYRPRLGRRRLCAEMPGLWRSENAWLGARIPTGFAKNAAIGDFAYRHSQSDEASGPTASLMRLHCRSGAGQGSPFCGVVRVGDGGEGPVPLGRTPDGWIRELKERLANGPS
jgi:hypothetical protein